MEIFIKRNKNKRLLILDIPLFLENKLNKKNDLIIFIQSPSKKINKRLLKRVNYNKRLIDKFREVQWSSQKKKKKSHFVIKNYFERKKAINSVNIILKKVL